MAAADKQRYQTEMKDYTPPAGSESKKSSAIKKEQKDPNAPKKAMTAFFYFSTEMRPKIKKDNPDMSFGDLGKKIGELYRALSADEKKRYEDMAKKDKERYKKAQIEFDKRKKTEDDGVDDSDDDDSDEGSNKADDDDDSDDDDDE